MSDIEDKRKAFAEAEANLRKTVKELGIHLDPLSKEELDTMVRSTQDFMVNLLRQEYELHEGAWWLWSLGKPARPLSEAEIAEAKARGDIS